ncbi:MAG: hypothetical protein IJO57_05430 [Bacilli bacterium]|nr:hypothetical protein [Bacilli bacterium]
MDVLKRVTKLILIIAFFIVGLHVLFAIMERIDKNKFNKEFNELLNLRKELIIKIKNNEIEFDEYKFAKLSEEYEQVAANSKVSILMNTEEETLIGFLYKPGFPDEDQYIYYSNKDDKFIKEQIGKSNVYSIEIIIDDWYFVRYN